MTIADKEYIKLLSKISLLGEVIESRNGTTKRLFDIPRVVFESFPLITLRKTAWKMAIREMQWFLSGEKKCPEELFSWWKDQLNEEGLYYLGYGHQLRHFNDRFDQINEMLAGLKSHPYSRRHVITTWNPEDMSWITAANNNEKTPTTCHTTIAQFFCSTDNTISMSSYQRSADMLLGVPHNWVQSWALLLWLARQTGRQIKKMIWTFGDAHIYMEESHRKTLQELLSCPISAYDTYINLLYNGEVGKPFDVNDFSLSDPVSRPLVITRPRLL